MENLRKIGEGYEETFAKFKKENPNLFLQGSEFQNALRNEVVSARVAKQQTNPPVSIDSMVKGKKKAQELSPERQAEIESNYRQHAKRLQAAWARKFKPTQKKPLQMELIELDKAKKIVYRIMLALKPKGKELDFNRKALIRHGGGHSEVLTYKKLLHELTVYFARSKGGSFNLNRGFLFFGIAGCGKSFLMEVFTVFGRIAKNADAFLEMSQAEQHRSILAAQENLSQTALCIDSGMRHVEMAKIIDTINSSKDIAKIHQFLHGNVAYDDIGFHNENIQAYGNKANCFEFIISRQYKPVTETNKVIHATTNLLPKAPKNKINANTILSTYGERIYSRCKQMFTFVNLQGKDFRG